MRALLLVMALGSAAYADGVPMCKNCNARGDASIGSGLALIGLVAYRLGRKRS